MTSRRTAGRAAVSVCRGPTRATTSLPSRPGRRTVAPAITSIVREDGHGSAPVYESCPDAAGTREETAASGDHVCVDGRRENARVETTGGGGRLARGTKTRGDGRNGDTGKREKEKIKRGGFFFFFLRTVKRYVVVISTLRVNINSVNQNRICSLNFILLRREKKNKCV